MMDNQELSGINLAGPCGFYCGICRQYLARAKGLLREKNLKDGCRGCREQDKNCAWIKKDCALIRKKQITFCFECRDFPCANLKELDRRHIQRDSVSPIDNLMRIKEIGAEQWLREQQAKWRCPRCGGDICVTDNECYDCELEID